MSSLTLPEKKHQLLTKVLKRFKVFPSSVGCLWVKENSWLNTFSENQSIRWTVSDKEDLITMKEQYPVAKLYAHSLLSFRFPTTLQLIYALDTQFQSVGWTKSREKLVQKCYDHLEPYGMLIFDLHMPKSFDEKQDSQQLNISKDQVILTNQSIKKWLLNQQTVTFKINEEGTYDREDQTIKQQLLWITDLKKMLKWFETIEFLDHNWRKANTKTKHVVVVVQKGW